MMYQITNFISRVPSPSPGLFALLSLQFVLTILLGPGAALITIGSLLSANLLAAPAMRKASSQVLTQEEYLKDVKLGRWTAQPDLEEEVSKKGLSQKGIVCFVLGASVNQYVLAPRVHS